MMPRLTWPLRFEQTAILAAWAGVILMGIGSGLPSKEGMGLLLAGGPPTQEQIERLNSLHTMRAQGRIPPDSMPPRRQVEVYPPLPLPEWYASSTPGPWLSFTEVERLYALRSYILYTITVDEDYAMVAIGNMNPRKLDFDPKRYIYGGSYLYPVGFMLFAMQSAGLLHVTRDFAYYLDHPSQIARIYVAGRLLNLLAFMGTLVLLALLGRRFGSETAGTLAMLAYGLSTLIINHTVVMKPHVFTAFWVTLAVYLLVLHAQRGRLRPLVLSILFAGYAAGSTALAAAAGLLYPIFLFERARPLRTLRLTLLALVGMTIVFLATNPYSILNFDAYRGTVMAEMSERRAGLGIIGLHKLSWYLQGAFVESYTFPVVLLGLPFMLWCCVRGSGPLRRLALATLGLLLMFGTTAPMVRHSSFVAPLFCLFAGLAVATWIIAPLRSKPLLRAALVGILFLPGVANAALTLRDIVSHRHWYEPTARWVHSARIGPETSIGLLFGPSPADLPPFPFLHARLIDLNSAAAVADPPEYVVIGIYRHQPQGLWQAHPLRSRYRLLYHLGYRRSYDWLRSDKRQDEGRTGGYVYRLVDPSPADARPAAGAGDEPRSLGTGSAPRGARGAGDTVHEPSGSPP